MSRIEKRLSELGIILPDAPKPLAAYVPFTREDNLVFISGQLPLEKGVVAVTGKLGQDLDVATGQKAARLCALNILAQLKNACEDDLDRVKACLRLGGFVASDPTFTQQPEVMNGASEMMQEVFGNAGRHARAAVGVPVLPRDAAVEVDAIFSLN